MFRGSCLIYRKQKKTRFKMTPIPKEIIIRSIQRTATEEELSILNRWLKADITNRTCYFQLEEIWSSGKSLSEESIHQGWQMLAKQIEKQPQQHTVPRIKQKIVWWRYVAAVFIGVLIASAIWFAVPTRDLLSHSIVQNVVYNKSGVQSVVLPDQSEVWLNENSRLTYPEVFVKKKRLVALEGKGYFDIRSSKEKPFVVQIGEVTIEVTGTEFFVESVFDETSSVTLISGKVNLNYEDSNGNLVSTPLVPGQQAHINSVVGTVEIENVDTDYYIAWKDGTYRFTDERLEKIAAMLAQHYGLEIRVSPSLKDKRFTGRVMSGDSVEEVLKSIGKSYPVRYRISDKLVRIIE